MFDAVGGVEPLLDPQLHPHRGILKISRLSGFQVPHRQWSSHTASKHKIQKNHHNNSRHISIIYCLSRNTHLVKSK